MSSSLPSAVLFGRYRLVEQLGAGGMARVFRSVIDGPKGFAHELVIKRIRPEYSRNLHFVNMLAAEARLCGLLRHPSIVQVHEFGEVGGDYYLAMELVEGHDLLAVTRALQRAGRRMPLGIACLVINELAGALDHAHALTDPAGRSLEIVHRDISPSNIMIGRLGTVKLLDFGIAKAAAHVRDEHTNTGTLKGKIGYMSPEQAEGLALDGRSDLFALGVVFWEILTQQRLFRGEGEMERLRMVREARVEPPSRLVPGLHPVVDAIVMKLLARRREERYQRGAEVMEALTPLASHAAALRQLVTELKPFYAPRTAGVVAPDDAKQLPDSLPVGMPVPEVPASREYRVVSSTLTGAASRGELRPMPDTVRMTPWRSMRRWAVPAALGAALGLLGVGAGGGWWRAGMSGGAPAAVAPAASAKTAAANAATANAATANAATANAAAANAANAANANAATANAATATTRPPVDLPAATPPEVAHVVTTTFAPEPVERSPERVRLRVAGPDHADVFIDGKLMGKAPLDVALDPVDGERQLLVQKPGYAPWTRKIAGDVTMALTPKLARKRGGAGGRRGDDVYDPFAR